MAPPQEIYFQWIGNADRMGEKLAIQIIKCYGEAYDGIDVKRASAYVSWQAKSTRTDLWRFNAFWENATSAAIYNTESYVAVSSLADSILRVRRLLRINGR